MSSKELSERASVTASYISQVENGIITPSIDTLRNIAKALEVPVFHFFLDEDNFNKVVSSSDREIVEFPNVDLKYEIISSNLKNKIGVMIGKLGVNSQTTKELRSHAGEECILVIQGELQVETLSNKIILKKMILFISIVVFPIVL